MLISVAKKTGYVVAVCIVTAAILVSASRFLSPVLDKHRADFENYASQLLTTPVTIDKVSFSWYRYQPVIRFDQVTILNKENKTPVLQIQKVRVFFSIPKSIWQRKFVPSGIMIAGTDLNLRETATGEISVQGFPSFGGFKNQPYNSETKFKDILGWLSQQPRLILHDIDLRYTGLSGKKRFVTLYDLSFQNSGSEHNILGKAVLHQDIPTEITLAAQWQGENPDPAQLKAKVYLYVSGLSLSQWTKGLSWKGWQINQGITSAKIWATWNHGAFRKIQSTFELYGLDLSSKTDQSTHKINRLSGNIGWKQNGNTQVFAGDDLLIDLPEHLWPVTSFYVSLEANARNHFLPKVIKLGYVDLNDIKSYLFSSEPLLPKSVQQMIAELQPKGALQNTAITFSGALTDWNHTSFNTNFSQLSFASWHKLPGVDNLSGVMKWDGTSGDLTLNSSRVVVHDDATFFKPINIDQIIGNLHLQYDQTDTWKLQISTLQLLNDDLAANLNGSLTIPPTASPMADMQANFTLQKADHLQRYLPMRVFDPDLIEWLQNAFLSGEVKSGNVVLRGKLADFPFDNHNGVFSISTIIKNMDFRYASAWPIMHNLNGKLTFLGRKMLIDIDSTKIMGIPLTNVHGEIPYFGDAEPQILHVTSNDIQTDFTQAQKLVQASPLQKTIGNMFMGVDLNGPTTLKLGLIVPLKHPDKAKVQGALTLKDTEMKMLPWHLALNKLNGLLQFTEDSVTAQNIQGELFHQPLRFNLATKQKTKDLSVVQANFATHLNISELESWLKLPFTKVVQGGTDVTGQADFSLKTPIEILLQSKLVGVAVNLPDQYGKKAQEARDFSVRMTLQEKQPLRMKLGYGKLFSTALILDRQDEKFSLQGANLHFGTGQANWPATNGLYITGNFDKLDVDKLKDYAAQSGDSNRLSSIKLRGVDIQAKILRLAGNNLNDIRLQATPIPNNWKININSPDIDGQLHLPDKFTRQSVVYAEFKQLKLHTEPNTTKSIPKINVKELPSISFIADNVSYNDMPIGQVSFRTFPSSSGSVIRGLRIYSPNMDLLANGEWTQSGNNYVTHLHGNATSGNVTKLLNSFGFDVHNFVSSNGRLNFNLSWRDAPYSPAVSSMNGSAGLDMGKGQIVDIGQASGAKMDIGRLLSIFSLQTIPRRLTGDFSDLFQKGYSFDSVRGNFVFQNGDVFTSNMRIDGPIARVDIDGRIGLKNKDYNFTLSVTPYVTSLTSSIPVAAATLGIINPLAGLAALAVNSVVGPQVSKIITYYYAVTGPWDNPSWKSISVANSAYKSQNNA